MQKYNFSVNIADISDVLESWEQILLDELATAKQLSPTTIARLWGVTTRTARTRLNKMVESGRISRIATAPKDPHVIFRLNERY